MASTIYYDEYGKPYKLDIQGNRTYIQFGDNNSKRFTSPSEGFVSPSEGLNIRTLSGNKGGWNYDKLESNPIEIPDMSKPISWEKTFPSSLFGGLTEDQKKEFKFNYKKYISGLEKPLPNYRLKTNYGQNLSPEELALRWRQGSIIYKGDDIFRVYGWNPDGSPKDVETVPIGTRNNTGRYKPYLYNEVGVKNALTGFRSNLENEFTGLARSSTAKQQEEGGFLDAVSKGVGAFTEAVTSPINWAITGASNLMGGNAILQTSTAAKQTNPLGESANELIKTVGETAGEFAKMFTMAKWLEAASAVSTTKGYAGLAAKELENPVAAWNTLNRWGKAAESAKFGLASVIPRMMENAGKVGSGQMSAKEAGLQAASDVVLNATGYNIGRSATPYMSKLWNNKRKLAALTVGGGVIASDVAGWGLGMAPVMAGEQATTQAKRELLTGEQMPDYWDVVMSRGAIPTLAMIIAGSTTGMLVDLPSIRQEEFRQMKMRSEGITPEAKTKTTGRGRARTATQLLDQEQKTDINKPISTAVEQTNLAPKGVPHSEEQRFENYTTEMADWFLGKISDSGEMPAEYANASLTDGRAWLANFGITHPETVTAVLEKMGVGFYDDMNALTSNAFMYDDFDTAWNNYIKTREKNYRYPNTKKEAYRQTFDAIQEMKKSIVGEDKYLPLKPFVGISEDGRRGYIAIADPRGYMHYIDNTTKFTTDNPAVAREVTQRIGKTSLGDMDWNDIYAKAGATETAAEPIIAGEQTAIPTQPEPIVSQRPTTPETIPAEPAPIIETPTQTGGIDASKIVSTEQVGEQPSGQKSIGQENIGGVEQQNQRQEVARENQTQEGQVTEAVAGEPTPPVTAAPPDLKGDVTYTFGAKETVPIEYQPHIVQRAGSKVKEGGVTTKAKETIVILPRSKDYELFPEKYGAVKPIPEAPTVAPVEVPPTEQINVPVWKQEIRDYINGDLKKLNPTGDYQGDYEKRNLLSGYVDDKKVAIASGHTGDTDERIQAYQAAKEELANFDKEKEFINQNNKIQDLVNFEAAYAARNDYEYKDLWAEDPRKAIIAYEENNQRLIEKKIIDYGSPEENNKAIATSKKDVSDLKSHIERHPEPIRPNIEVIPHVYAGEKGGTNVKQTEAPMGAVKGQGETATTTATVEQPITGKIQEPVGQIAETQAPPVVETPVPKSKGRPKKTAELKQVPPPVEGPTKMAGEEVPPPEKTVANEEIGTTTQAPQKPTIMKQGERVALLHAISGKQGEPRAVYIIDEVLEDRYVSTHRINPDGKVVKTNETVFLKDKENDTWRPFKPNNKAMEGDYKLANRKAEVGDHIMIADNKGEFKYEAVVVNKQELPENQKSLVESNPKNLGYRRVSDGVYGLIGAEPKTAPSATKKPSDRGYRVMEPKEAITGAPKVAKPKPIPEGETPVIAPENAEAPKGRLMPDDGTVVEDQGKLYSKHGTFESVGAMMEDADPKQDIDNYVVSNKKLYKIKDIGKGWVKTTSLDNNKPKNFKTTDTEPYIVQKITEPEPPAPKPKGTASAKETVAPIEQGITADYDIEELLAKEGGYEPDLYSDKVKNTIATVDASKPKAKKKRIEKTPPDTGGKLYSGPGGLVEFGWKHTIKPMLDLAWEKTGHLGSQRIIEVSTRYKTAKDELNKMRDIYYKGGSDVDKLFESIEPKFQKILVDKKHVVTKDDMVRLNDALSQVPDSPAKTELMNIADNYIEQMNKMYRVLPGTDFYNWKGPAAKMVQDQISRILKNTNLVRKQFDDHKALIQKQIDDIGDRLADKGISKTNFYGIIGLTNDDIHVANVDDIARANEINNKIVLNNKPQIRERLDKNDARINDLKAQIKEARLQKNKTVYKDLIAERKDLYAENKQIRAEINAERKALKKQYFENVKYRLTDEGIKDQLANTLDEHGIKYDEEDLDAYLPIYRTELELQQDITKQEVYNHLRNYGIFNPVKELKKIDSYRNLVKELNDLRTKQKEARIAKNIQLNNELADQIKQFKTDNADDLYKANAIIKAHDRLNYSRNTQHVTGKFNQEIADKPFGLSIYEVDEKGQRKANHNAKFNHMYYFGKEQERIAFLDKWTSDNKIKEMSKQLYVDEEGRTYKVNNSINTLKDRETKYANLAAMRDIIMKHLDGNIAITASDQAAMKSKIAEFLELAKGQDGETDAAYDATLAKEIRQMKEAIDDNMNLFDTKDIVGYTKAIRNIFDRVLTPKNIYFRNTRNVRGYRPKSLADANVWLLSGLEDSIDREGFKYRNINSKRAIRDHMILMQKLGLHNLKFYNNLRNFYSSFDMPSAEGKVTDPTLSGSLTKASRIANEVDKAVVVGLLGAVPNQFVKNSLQARITMTMHLAKNLNKLPLVDLAKLPAKLTINELRGLLITPLGKKVYQKLGGDLDNLYKNDPFLHDIQQKILNSPEMMATSAAQMDSAHSLLANKRMQNAVMMFSRYSEAINRYVSAMLEVELNAKYYKDLVKDGTLTRKEAINELFDSALTTANNTQGYFDYPFRSRPEQWVLNKVPFGKRFLTMKGPAIHQMYYWLNDLYTAAATADKKAIAAVGTAVLGYALTGGLDNIPTVPDQEIIYDILKPKKAVGYKEKARSIWNDVATKRFGLTTEQATDWWLAVDRGLVTKLTGGNYGMRNGILELVPPLLGGIIPQFTQDVISGKNAFGRILPRYFTIPGRIYRGGKNVLAGQYLDPNGNPLRGGYGWGQFVNQVIQGENPQDLEARSDIYRGGKVQTGDYALSSALNDLADMERLSVEGLKKKDLTAFKQVLNSRMQANKEVSNKIRQIIWDSEGKSSKYDQHLETSLNKLDEFFEKNPNLIDVLGREGNLGEMYGTNVDMEQYKEKLKNAVERYVDTKKNADLIQSIFKYLNIKDASNKDRQVILNYDKMEYKGKPIGEIKPEEERPYYYALKLLSENATDINTENLPFEYQQLIKEYQQMKKERKKKRKGNTSGFQKLEFAKPSF